MRYRTQSADVLNEADRAQRIMDWQLFQQEMSFLWNPGQIIWHEGEIRNQGMYFRWNGSERTNGYGRIVTYDPETWMPGDSLYVRPWDHSVGNQIRLMFSEFDDIESSVYTRAIWGLRGWCPDCEVAWAPDWNADFLKPVETPCWMCGVVPEVVEESEGFDPLFMSRGPSIGRVIRTSEDDNSVTFTLDVDISSFREAAERAGAQMAEFMEAAWSDYQEAWRRSVESFTRQQIASYTAEDVRTTLGLFRISTIQTPRMRGRSAGFVIYDEAPEPTTPEMVEMNGIMMPVEVDLSGRAAGTNLSVEQVRELLQPPPNWEQLWGNWWVEPPVTEQRRRRDG